MAVTDAGPDAAARAAVPLTACRSCGDPGVRRFLDLGVTPLADNLVPPERAGEPEPRYPLEVGMCPSCSLVQILHDVPPEQLFVENYLYFSSFSPHLLDHARRHAEGLVADPGLDGSSLVVELASNDGYLLRNFAARGIPVLGIDPAPEPAAAAEAAGIPTLREFFGIDLARRLTAEGRRADVIIANNVMAHVPDLNGFVAGMAELLDDDGVITVENPYVRDLVDHAEFDTIYHEHHCYFSCHAVDALVRRHGLHLNDVTEFPDLHGGTLRWTIAKVDRPTARVRRYLDDEDARGMTSFGFYAALADDVERVRRDLPALLHRLRDDGARLAAYGAAAKGSTLLNVTGVGTDLLDFVVDRNVHKQGLLMPGVHLPILDPAALLERRPDHVLLLAWNFADEIAAQQQAYLDGGGRFVIPVPEPRIR